MEIYAVGGAVRDELLGRPIKERDWVVVGSTPDEMKALGFQQVGKDFPVFLHPKTHEEYALARTERKTGHGYTQFTCHATPDVTLEEDLKRRDLTINAIAKTVDGQLIDPYGGQKDLENRLLRHVSEAFVEDPVRILRIARFAARYAYLGFSIADETMRLMREMVRAGEVDALVAERVWQELCSALHEKNPDVFFTVLRACGALKVIFPELDQLFGVPNPPKWHSEIDSGIHTLLVLKEACRLSNDPEVRFAALLHDLGKGLTPWHRWPSHAGHEDAGAALIKSLCTRYRVPKNYTDLALLVGKYHGLCHKAFELKASTLVKCLKKLDAIRKPERFQQFLTACTADFYGRPGHENQTYSQAAFMQKVFEVVRKVPIKPLIEAGLTSAKLGEALYQAQISAVKTFLFSLKNTLYIPPKGSPAPSMDAVSHASALLDVILSAIKKNQGKISFEHFMKLALYAPGLGYYSAGSEKIGASGDFVTAPEISRLFSYCIAKQCKQVLEQLGGGNILEFGAGSGKMAVDILTYLSERDALPQHYFILETSADLKEKQRKRFEKYAAHLLPHVHWLETLPTQFRGIMLANEVLDAFPVHRFLIDKDVIQEYYVGWENNAFVWLTDKVTSPELEDEVKKIKKECLSEVEHYTSELNLRVGPWLQAVSESLVRGAILCIDYGFPRELYYHPQRSQGTLMCHYRHHTHENPLILVGLQDITAHVDFSFIAESAVKAGLNVAEYKTQADFLLHCGILEQVEEQADLLKRLEISRQIQTLIMPHEMGELFKVMLLSKGVEI